MSDLREADEALRVAARHLLTARVAVATGKHSPANEASAWDTFALALDAAEDAALLAAHPDAPEGETREEFGTRCEHGDTQQPTEEVARLIARQVCGAEPVVLLRRTLRVGPWVEVES